MKIIIFFLAFFITPAFSQSSDIKSRVDKENEYWISVRVDELKDFNLPLNCESYGFNSFKEFPSKPLSFYQVRNNGSRLVIIWPKFGGKSRPIDFFQDIDIVSPFIDINSVGNKLSFTVYTYQNQYKLTESFLYDSQNKFIRFLTEFKGPPANQLAVDSNNRAIVEAKKNGLPGTPQIKCTGNLSSIK
jgi:hypothetical protein